MLKQNETKSQPLIICRVNGWYIALRASECCSDCWFGCGSNRWLNGWFQVAAHDATAKTSLFLCGDFHQAFNLLMLICSRFIFPGCNLGTRKLVAGWSVNILASRPFSHRNLNICCLCLQLTLAQSAFFHSSTSLTFLAISSDSSSPLTSPLDGASATLAAKGTRSYHAIDLVSNSQSKVLWKIKLSTSPPPFPETSLLSTASLSTKMTNRSFGKIVSQGRSKVQPAITASASNSKMMVFRSLGWILQQLLQFLHVCMKHTRPYDQDTKLFYRSVGEICLVTILHLLVFYYISVQTSNCVCNIFSSELLGCIVHTCKQIEKNHLVAHFFAFAWIVADQQGSHPTISFFSCIANM